MNSILDSSAVSQAQLLKKKKISALELTNLYLERIETLNPQLEAFSYVAYQSARKAAQKWDLSYSKHQGQQSLLSGVPIGIKDLNLVRFMPARMGSRAFHYFIPPFDDPVVSRIRKAGMIILGKTTTSEFGATPFSPAKNPWDHSRTAGGSSGGSASAVASKMLPIAHAADGGGSIRIPSALCGVLGFKASRGAVKHVTFSDKIRLVSDGPIARNFEDLQAFLPLLANRPEQFQLKVAPRTYKIIFHTSTCLSKTDPEIAQAVRETAKTLERAGHYLEEKPWPDFNFDDFSPMWYRTLADVPVLKESALESQTRWFRKNGKQISSQDLKKHLEQLMIKAEKWWGQDVDFHLCPTVPFIAPKIQDFSNYSPEKILEHMVPLGAYTALMNVMGYAAISLPAGFTQKDKMPMGIQLIAPQGHDAQLLELAHLIEQIQ